MSLWSEIMDKILVVLIALLVLAIIVLIIMLLPTFSIDNWYTPKLNKTKKEKTNNRKYRKRT